MSLMWGLWKIQECNENINEKKIFAPKSDYKEKYICFNTIFFSFELQSLKVLTAEKNKKILLKFYCLIIFFFQSKLHD